MNRLASLWRSMPIRLALLLVLLFFTVLLLSLAASYAVTQRSFEQAIRADLEQDIAGFRAAPSARAVALLVQAESRETDPGRLVLSYVTRAGRIYGNGAVARDGEGYHIVSFQDGTAGPARVSGEYLTLTTTLYGGQLTVARSLAEIAALGSVFVNILWISLLPTVLVALSGGLVLARRSKRHVDVIGGTLDTLTDGDLGARVTVGPRWSDDLQRIGEKLNQMAEAQEISVAALRQVSSDIAHDLKTPIQRVSLQLEELARSVPPEGEAGALVADAQAQVDHIGAVFQSLLQLAQIDSGSARARFVPVDLRNLAATMAELYEPSVAERHQSLNLDLPSAPVTVKGDRTLLGQLLANLIENAIRHTPEGAAISLALARTESGVTLILSDDGPGIPEGERSKVLQRLYRLDHSRNTPGNGLGLSLVEAVVRLHGATLALEDAGPGLRVTVAFPDTDEGRCVTNAPYR